MRDGNLPRLIHPNNQTSADLMLEHTDALKLLEWKKSLESNPAEFCPALKKFLNSKLKQWLEMKEVAPPETSEKVAPMDGNLGNNDCKKRKLSKCENCTNVEESNNDDNCSNTGFDEASFADFGSSCRSDATTSKSSKRLKTTSETSLNEVSSNNGSDVSTSAESFSNSGSWQNLHTGDELRSGDMLSMYDEDTVCVDSSLQRSSLSKKNNSILHTSSGSTNNTFLGSFLRHSDNYCRVIYTKGGYSTYGHGAKLKKSHGR